MVCIMLVCAPVAQKHRTTLPENVRELPLYDRLYLQRSTVPAITHVDWSARIQSVSRRTNPRYWGLIDTFHREHGCPMVVNTSFNVRGEPIVCTPLDAYTCFMRTEMDYLVLGDMIFDKREQPEWQENVDFKSIFTLD